MNNDKIPQENEKGLTIYVVVKHVSHEGSDTFFVTMSEAKAKESAERGAEDSYEDATFRIELWQDDKYAGTLDYERYGKLLYRKLGTK